MEQTSQASSDAQSNQMVLEGQLRECYGRIVYSHKTHEKCADILLERLSKIKLYQIILSAITTGTLLSTLFGSGRPGLIIATTFSTLLLVINTYTKDYDLGELAQKHKQAANDLWIIREQYLSLIVDLKTNISDLGKIKIDRDALLASLHTVYSGSPSTTYKAYQKAQRALKANEDMTFSDQEIDAFLPKELKRN